MRVALTVAAAGLVLVGCGTPKPAASAADVAPLDTYALMKGDATKARRALDLVPAGRRLVALLARARAASGGGGDTTVAALDPSGRSAVAITHGDPPAGLPHARVRGWTVFSRDRAAVDAVRHAKRRLTASSWYRPVEADVTLQLRGVTVTASGDGGVETADQGVLVTRDVEHPLAALIPDDALAAAVFDRTPDVSFAEQLERGLGIRFADLGALTSHGGVAFLRAGRPVPSVTLIARGASLAAARRVIAELDPAAPSAVPASLDGVPMQLVHFGALDLSYGRYHGAVVVTDDPGLRLHDVTALEPDGLPGRNGGWTYLAPEQGLPALESLATLADTKLSREWVARVSGVGSVLSYRAKGRVVVRVESR